MNGHFFLGGGGRPKFLRFEFKFFLLATVSIWSNYLDSLLGGAFVYEMVFLTAASFALGLSLALSSTFPSSSIGGAKEIRVVPASLLLAMAAILCSTVRDGATTLALGGGPRTLIFYPS